jgi:hypothetical protein
MRICKGWGSLDELLWPYDGEASHWPPIEPNGIDLKAKEHRILAYQRISTVDECRIVLASEHLVVVGFNIDDSWFSAIEGIIPQPDKQPIVGAHAVCLVGYDDNKQTFIILNSWGVSWGDAGYGYLPYSYFQNRFLEGWSLINIDNRSLLENATGIKILTYGIKDLFNRTLHCVEIFDSIKDEMIAWSFAIENKTFLDIEELFVRPNWRKKGYAIQIVNELTKLSAGLEKKLYAWIPHPDGESSNQHALIATFRHLGLTLKSSPEQWAFKIGV